MVSYASLREDDAVLEIGAGLGLLTERLAEKAGRVIAVEVDSRLVRMLESRLSNRRNVTILQGDILKAVVPSFDKVVSTPPYSISSPFLFWLLGRNFKEAVLAFQEEFARRLAATPGSDDYGRLTVTTYYRAEVELLDHVPKEVFWPPPKVDSTIVRLTPRKPPFSVIDEEVFFELVRALFSQKNRKMKNAVLPFFSEFGVQKGKVSELVGGLPFRDRRPRELSPEEIGLAANEVVGSMRRLSLL